jgi:hypothetical protein
MELKPLTESDLETVRPFLAKNKSHFNDYTIGSVYMWRHSYQIEFAIIENTLIVKEEYESGKFAFLFPIGAQCRSGFKRDRFLFFGTARVARLLRDG